jgi:hypothetical protein
MDGLVLRPPSVAWRRDQRKVLICGLLFFLFVSNSGRMNAAIEIQKMSSLAIHPTRPTVITFTGRDFVGTDKQFAKLWVSFPAEIRLMPDAVGSSSKLTFEITPQKIPVGLQSARLFTDREFSNPMLMVVDSIESTAFDLPANSGNLPPFVFPFGVSLETKDRESVKIPVDLRQGKRVVVEAVADRLGIDVDLVIRLLDGDGRVIARHDDHPFTGADPLFSFTPHDDGLHYLVCHDVQYRGGRPFRLRVAEESIQSVVYPSVVGGEKPVLLHINDPVNSRKRGRVSRQLVPSRRDSGNDLLDMAGLNHGFACMMRTAWPLYTEPVHVAGGGKLVVGATVAPSVSAPAVICGYIDVAGRVDQWLIHARKGEKIVFRSLADAIRTPAIPKVKVLNSGGGLIGSFHWASNRQGEFTVAFPEDGHYRLQVEEGFGRGGFEFQYCLELSEPKPSSKISLSARPNNRKDLEFSVGVSGGTVSIPIKFQQQEPEKNLQWRVYSRAKIACKVVGFQWNKDKKNEGTLEVLLPENVTELRLLPLKMVALSNADQRSSEVNVDLLASVPVKLSRLPSLPGHVTDYFPLIVKPKIKLPENKK